MSLKKKYLVIILLLYFSLIFSLYLYGCNTTVNNSKSEGSRYVNNLEKLCKVWGYTKYNHPAFLLGQKDWDEELLSLIPAAFDAEEDELNHILHEWFVGLGEIDYQSNRSSKKLAEDEIIVQADTSWIFDVNYLEEDLTADLMQLGPIPGISHSKAPVSLVSESGVMLPDFSNEKIYKDMDYGDKGYRLLGLFRLWNAMEYNYPYLDILDENWHSLLPEFISDMLEGTDKHSYELTLAALGAKLRDAHVYFDDGYFLLEEFGEYGVAVEITEAEGKIIVWKVHDPDCSLQVGDVICKLEGKEIEEVIKNRQKYIATTTDDKLINSLSGALIRSHNQEFEVTVLRDDCEQTLLVNGYPSFFSTRAVASEAYEILEGNIGLMNPAAMPQNDFHSIMKSLADTEGLIIDLRQYPSTPISYALAAYIVDDYQTFAVCSVPSQSVPGTFLKTNLDAGYVDTAGIQQYDKKVVVLIDEKTQSRAEYAVMAVRNSENVTVMGENSVGSDGAMTSLPLPGGLNMMFSSQGIYTPEMKQTQRIGLAPDIEVHPTVKGIQEGRDELMEAAVAFLRNGDRREEK